MAADEAKWRQLRTAQAHLSTQNLGLLALRYRAFLRRNPDLQPKVALSAALKKTAYAKAQPERIRSLFLKVAGRFELKGRSICVRLPQNYPHKHEWVQMNQALRE